MQKVGAFLLKDLKSNDLNKEDVISLIQFVLDNPVYFGNNVEYEGYKISKRLRKFLVNLLERYVILNPKYEPLRDAVILNHSYEKQVIEAFNILTSNRNINKDQTVITAIDSGFELVREKLNIKNEDILQNGNTFQNLKVAFRKRLM